MAPGHGGRGRLPRPLGSQLAAGCPDLLAAVPPDGHADPGGLQAVRERLDPVGRARLPRSVGDRVHGDAVDVAAAAGQEARQRVGVRRRVVEPIDHHVLVAHPAARRRGVPGRRGDHRSNGPAPVQRHQEVAQRVARRVEADRQRPLRAHRGQPLDPRHHARSRYRQVAGTQPEALGVRDDDGRLHDGVEVQERLAHAHEDEVRQVTAAGCQAAPGVPDLVDDLGDVQVTLEPELAGGAERAPDGTAGLAADAQRVPLAPRAARRVVHQDALHEPPIGQLVQRLLRGAIVGDADLGRGQRIEAQSFGKPGPKRPAQGGHVVPPSCLRAPHRVGDLPGSKRRLSHPLQDRGERGRLHAGHAGARVSRGARDRLRLCLDGRFGHPGLIIPPVPR